MSDSSLPRFKPADYKDQGLPEYTENPLISALPYIMSPAKVVEELARRPDKDDEKELSLEGHIRVHAIARLTRNFFVPQTIHIVLEQKISQMIRKSYLGRNPKTADFKRKLNEIREKISQMDLMSYSHDVVDSPATSMAIAGISGAGKSTATNRILDTYDRVIYHPEYHLLQVPWIKIDCPYDGSLSEFCESFFIALDKRLNTSYRQKYTSGKPSIGKMMADVADLCLIHAVGLIFVDEFQHMNLAKSGGEKKMINFLVTLVNVVEVSVVLIGTPKALHLFASEFRQARRASGEGSIVWDRMPRDDSWDEFIEELWHYQWLQSSRPLDEALTNRLYDLTQGVPDIVVKLFSLAQARAILLAQKSEEEYLSIELLDDVFEEEFSIVKPMLDALRRGNRKVIEKCDDLVIPKIDGTLLNSFDHLRAQSLNATQRVETGEAKETDLVNSAIEMLVSMGTSPDIAQPLVVDLINAKPEITLLQIINQATTQLTPVKSNSSVQSQSKEKPIYAKPDTWGQLKNPDLRKVYADKTGTMYEAMCDKGLVYPVNELLTG